MEQLPKKRKAAVLGKWKTEFDYVEGDIVWVFQESKQYFCKRKHSSEVFMTDMSDFRLWKNKG